MTAAGPAAGRGTVRVGITGHRPNRMPERHWDRVRRDLAAAMAAIEAAHPGRRLTLLSGLAEGADRLAAFVALGRGWRLHAVLAFPRARFEADFPAAASRGEFRALLKACARVEEPEQGRRKSRDAGYHAVGQRLLERCEVLIAVWDGEPSRGKGGAVAVLEEACARGLPVLWIHARRAQPVRQLPPADRMRRVSDPPGLTPQQRR